MNRAELLEFLRRHRLCVEASVSPSATPQAAVVGYAVSDDLEIVFDTSSLSRKALNLRRHPRAAIVVGWDNEQTVQLEGDVDEPKGDALARLKKIYFQVYPDGVDREKLQDTIYIRVRPTWGRYSDFRPGGRIVQLGRALTVKDR